MLAATRVLAIALIARTVVATELPGGSDLVATWRSDDGVAVEEYAFRADHSFISWFQSKTELHTPGVIIETGVWQLDGHWLRIIPKKTNSVRPRKPFIIQIIRMSGNRLITRLRNGKSGTLRRLELPTCDGAQNTINPALLNRYVLGTWQMHRLTHDYTMTFHADHTFTGTINFEGTSFEIPAGRWHFEASELIVHLKKEKGESEELGFHWQIVAVERNCVAIKDGSIPYTWKRLK